MGLLTSWAGAHFQRGSAQPGLPSMTLPCPLQQWREPNGDTDLPGLPVAPDESRENRGCLWGDPPADEKLLSHDPNTGRWEGERVVGQAEEDIRAELPGAGSLLPTPQWYLPPGSPSSLGRGLFRASSASHRGLWLFPGKGFPSLQFWS